MLFIIKYGHWARKFDWRIWNYFYSSFLLRERRKNILFFSYLKQILLVVMLSIELRMGCTDAEQNIDSLMMICCGILGTLKTICFRIYASNLTDNYNSVVNDYQTNDNIEQRTVMRKHTFIGRTLCYSMIFCSYFDSSIYAMVPLLNDQNGQINDSVVLKYTIPSRCTLEYFSVPRNMSRTLSFIQYIILIFTCTGNFGKLCLLLNISVHISCSI